MAIQNIPLAYASDNEFKRRNFPYPERDLTHETFLTQELPTLKATRLPFPAIPTNNIHPIGSVNCHFAPPLT
jgi:hypothetical protein